MARFHGYIQEELTPFHDIPQTLLAEDCNDNASGIDDNINNSKISTSELLLFPVDGVILFPGETVPIRVSRDTFADMVAFLTTQSHPAPLSSSYSIPSSSSSFSSCSSSSSSPTLTHTSLLTSFPLGVVHLSRRHSLATTGIYTHYTYTYTHIHTTHHAHPINTLYIHIHTNTKQANSQPV